MMSTRSAIFATVIVVATSVASIAPARAYNPFVPPFPSFSTGSGPAGLALGDLNGDSIPDLAVTTELADSVTILLGAGDGRFIPVSEYATAPYPGTVSIADL